jgi:glucosamine 6-phosphate synthetase-like amidotransferase/phosphosugar isomerase protein
MTFGSLSNSHAFGFFNREHSFKKRGIFNLQSFEVAKLMQDNFIVGHNRFTTQGSESKNGNNHPFELNGFSLVHNGILEDDKKVRKKFGIKSKIQTDSYTILWLINKFYHESAKTKTHKKMVEAIQKTCKELEGYYSVFVFDKETKDLYYFRNDRADFQFCLIDDNIILGSTDFNNLEYVYTNKKYIFDEQTFTKKTFKEPKAERVYMINDRVIIKEIGKFEENLSSYFKQEKEIYHNRYYDYDYDETDLHEEVESEGEEDSLKGLKARDLLVDEIDATFEGIFGFVPNYKLTKKDTKIKIKSDDLQEDTKALAYFIEGVKKGKKHLFIDVDEFLSANYLIK